MAEVEEGVADCAAILASDKDSQGRGLSVGPLEKCTLCRVHQLASGGAAAWVRLMHSRYDYARIGCISHFERRETLRLT